MNPEILKAIYVIITAKMELRTLTGVFIFILSLPIIGILVITNTGTNVVSNALATLNGTTHLITVHDPLGKMVTQIQATTVWPVKGVVTLEFGESDLPYQPLHTGIDIADKTGDPITPFMKGKIIDVEHLSWGYGNYVVIDHGNNITSLYGHMNQTKATIGQDVKPGDIIGYEGQTGWTTGPHVHFEIRVLGIPVNPRTFVEGNP